MATVCHENPQAFRAGVRPAIPTTPLSLKGERVKRSALEVKPNGVARSGKVWQASQRPLLDAPRAGPPPTPPKTDAKHCRCCLESREREGRALSRAQVLVNALERLRARYPECDGEIREALRWPQ